MDGPRVLLPALCPHGHASNDARTEGMGDIAMAAPYFWCGCCGIIQFYVDSGMYGTAWWRETTWVPKDRCAECGGGYETTEGLDLSHEGPVGVA